MFEMFDFSLFIEASAKNGPLVVLIVMCLVTLLGKFGVKGKAQLGSALGIGLLMGGAFQIAVLGVPGDFAGWFFTSLYGLMMGVTSSLGYEVGKDLVTKVVARTIGMPEDLHKG